MKKIINIVLVCFLAIFSFFGISGNLVKAKSVVSEVPNLNKSVNSLSAEPEWLDTVDEPENYDYSFAIVGDIQNVTYKYPDKVDTIYSYIVDNVESKKIAHVFTLGDITEGDSLGEWKIAKKAISKMDGVVPYSLVRGNHDGKTNYLATFGNSSSYRKQYKASFLSSLNTAVEFSVGELDYLVLNLDYVPSDEVINWANSVVAAHPYHNVIVTTHTNLDAEGNRNDDETTGGNGGTKQWEKLLSKHSNIVLGLYGHIDDEYLEVIQTPGDNGNIVSEMLIDPQRTDLLYDGGVGLVAFFYFSNGGKHVDVRYYSTIRNQYYRPENQFSFEINTIPRNQ